MKSFLKFPLKFLSYLTVFAFSMGVGLVLYSITLLPGLPTVSEIRQIPLNIPLRIYSRDEKLIAEYGNERRIPVTLDDAPPLLIDAILATEDSSFYYHTGVDFPGIIRAIISNLKSGSRGQGASTITMQVARNFFLNPEKTYTRKLKEILLAFNIERALTKDEILELYLNKIFLGHRSYGFAAAAQTYYGTSLKDLSVPEIAMLAGLPKAPSSDNPISNPERASERRSYVLRRLFELGKIDDFSYRMAQEAPITADRHIADIDVSAPYIAEMARQEMIEAFGDEAYSRGFNVTVTVDSEYQKQANRSLRQGLFEYDTRHGYRGVIKHFSEEEIESTSLDELLSPIDKSHELVPALVQAVNDDSILVDTIDQQNISILWDDIKWAREHISPNVLGPELSHPDQVVNSGDAVYIRQLGEAHWGLSQMPNVSGALVSLAPQSGAILSLVGGFDYYLSKFNRATQALRQPGSNIKPFIYSAALDNGFTPITEVSAGPIVVEDDLEGIWRPQNYSKKFFGPTRLRKALSLSLNLVSVRLLRAIGIDKTIQYLEGFGFDKTQLPRSLSLSLGSTTITPLNLASGYATIANGGYRVKPYLIEKIVDADGNIIEMPEAPFNECIDCETSEDITDTADTSDIEINADESDLSLELPDSGRSMSRENAFLTQHIMKQVILTGTGRRALALNRGDLAGKTGTTNNFVDAWFSGFSPDVTTTVWVGFDEPSHLGTRESGATAALPVWVDYMGTVLPDFPETTPQPPENVIGVFINKETGLPTETDDPQGYLEYFYAGTEPEQPIQSTNSSGQTTDNNSSVETLF